MFKKLKVASLLVLLIVTFSMAKLSAQSGDYKMQPVVLKTRWAKDVNLAGAFKEYPRPQMTRENWKNLNGLWQYGIVVKDAAKPIKFNGHILVPYPIESALSGVKKALLPTQNLWYQRFFERPALKTGERVLLHFGAVDWQATVFVNDKEVGQHTGGYTGFSFDITDLLKSGLNELSVKVFDPTDQGIGPHGKQVLNPANIYYTPSSGIWQTVWLETVPGVHIKELTITPDIDNKLVSITPKINQNTKGYSVEIIANLKGKVVAGSTGMADHQQALRITTPHLWSPEDPFLYDLVVRIIYKGKVVDEVKSYFGMRKISIMKDGKGIDRIALNNKPYYNLGTLDQGFWPDGLYTAPTDEALAFDIKAIKAMGFNTIRKHIKVEPARWYYHCDRLGMLVWQDMVNPNQRLSEGSKPEFEKESTEILAQLHNYPCITTWVLFNEKWGQYDQERLTKWIKTIDPSRIVNGHSGEYLYVNNKLRSPSPNAYVDADMTDVHAYPNPMISLKQEGKARICGEFGGIGVPVPGHQWNDLTGWGYVQVKPAELEAKYKAMVDSLKKFKQQGLSGSIYTQPFDVEGEENGLMTYDREIVKIPFEHLKKIHAGLIDGESSSVNINLTVQAKDIDQEDTDEKYETFLTEFNNGKKDSAFVRRLSLMAIRKKDISNADRITDSYLKDVKHKFAFENLALVKQVTQSTNSPGFRFFLQDSIKINEQLGTDAAQEFLRMLIQREFDAKVLKVFNPNVDSLESATINNLGKIAEFPVWQTISNYYFLKLDVPAFVKYKMHILSSYPQLYNRFALGADSWYIFENAKTQDQESLEVGLKLSGLLKNIDPDNSNNLDTYANLLYKLGRKEEAIVWEEKAFKLDPKHPGIKEAFEKMKRGEKTWKD